MTTDTDADEDPTTGLWVLAVALTLGTVGVIVAGVLSGLDRQPTPIENILMSVILTAISVAAGWNITALADRYKSRRKRRERISKEKIAQKEIERNALSSVRRIFNLLDGFGRIEGLADQATREEEGSTPRAEMLTLFRVIAELAKTQREQASHSIQDWRYFAPEAIDAEFANLRAVREQPVEE
ncbi:hypothetical protein [Mycolicibacterium sp. A43C]